MREIIKLESQVCSLDLAKKLEKLGVKQESLFWWRWFEGTNDFELSDSQHLPEDVSAFTVAELGEMLPRWLTPKNIEYWLNQARISHGWAIGYKSMKHGLLNDEQIVDIDEADARAKMLCYLLENKLMAV